MKLEELKQQLKNVEVIAIEHWNNCDIVKFYVSGCLGFQELKSFLKEYGKKEQL